MSKTEQMKRWNYIFQFLKKKKEASLKEIQTFLESKDISLTNRTFLRDKDAILDVFGVEIECNKSKNIYYIHSEELEQGEDNVFDNLLLIEAYRETKGREDIMLFERRKARGLEHLNGLIHAITHRKIITFDYQKFWSDEKQQRVVEPYALKEFQHRWYLLAKEHQPKDGNTIMKTFGLDRITDVDIKSKSFRREKYNPQKAFEHSFGIISPNGAEPQNIVLAFDKEQGNYIKALPLHSSQKIVKETDEELVISLYLVPTYDFEREILSYGSRVQVLEPSALRKRMKEEIEIMLRKL